MFTLGTPNSSFEILADPAHFEPSLPSTGKWNQDTLASPRPYETKGGYFFEAEAGSALITMDNEPVYRLDAGL